MQGARCATRLDGTSASRGCQLLETFLDRRGVLDPGEFRVEAVLFKQLLVSAAPHAVWITGRWYRFSGVRPSSSAAVLARAKSDRASFCFLEYTRCCCRCLHDARAIGARCATRLDGASASRGCQLLETFLDGRGILDPGEFGVEAVLFKQLLVRAAL